MSLALDIYKDILRQKEADYNRAYQKWLVDYKHQRDIELSQARAEQQEQLEIFASNLNTRLRRLNSLGCLYETSQTILECHKYHTQDVQWTNYLVQTMETGREFLQPFRMLSTYTSSTAVKIEMVTALFFFLFKRDYNRFDACNYKLDISTLNTLAGWLKTHIAYFGAAGIRAADTHFSLFDCLPDDKKKELVSQKTKEGKTLQMFCGSEHLKSQSVLLRNIALVLQTTTLSPNFLSDESDVIKHVNNGGHVDIPYIVRNEIGTDVQSQMMGALDFFENFEFSKEIEVVFEQRPIWISVFSILAILQKSQPEYYTWLTNSFEQIIKKEIKPKPSVDHHVIDELNNMTHWFESPLSESDAYLCLYVTGYDYTGYLDTFNQYKKERKHRIHFSKSDFPTLNNYIQQAINGSTMTGALSPYFQLEGKK